MAYRIHITALSPRSGTTLLTELMFACFDIDAACAHESSVFKRPIQEFQIYCSKDPNDLSSVHWALRLDPTLWVICLIRDPRDVIVSMHAANPKKYCTNLGVWKHGFSSSRRLREHPRVLTLRYEDLVRNPLETQRTIQNQLCFLEPLSSFADFERIALPTPEAGRAMNGLRPIAQDRIGTWRLNKNRLVAQIAKHGSIGSILQEVGYEMDDSWKAELTGIRAVNGESVQAENRTTAQMLKIGYRQFQSVIRIMRGKWRVERLIRMRTS